jgi:polar amino acid transport system permease protein
MNLKRLFIAAEDGAPSRSTQLVSVLVSLILVAGIAIPTLRSSNLVWDWSTLAEYRQLFLQGWFNTLGISVAALILSSILGTLTALGTTSRILPVQHLCKGYITLIRGTPLLAQIYILFYVVAHAAGIENRFWSGVVALSLFSSAYIAEILRASMNAIAASQLESAAAIGLTPSQTLRHVILPQALRTVLPPLAGQFVSLIKDSSLLSIIGIDELTQNAKNVASYTFSNFESYVLLAVAYLCLTLPVSLLARHLERRVQYDH